jgi:hypothetical protein
VRRMRRNQFFRLRDRSNMRRQAGLRPLRSDRGAAAFVTSAALTGTNGAFRRIVFFDRLINGNRSLTVMTGRFFFNTYGPHCLATAMRTCRWGQSHREGKRPAAPG